MGGEEAPVEVGVHHSAVAAGRRTGKQSLRPCTALCVAISLLHCLGRSVEPVESLRRFARRSPRPRGRQSGFQSQRGGLSPRRRPSSPGARAQGRSARKGGREEQSASRQSRPDDRADAQEPLAALPRHSGQQSNSHTDVSPQQVPTGGRESRPLAEKGRFCQPVLLATSSSIFSTRIHDYSRNAPEQWLCEH